MSDLKANGGELRATVTVKRKATGKVETFELVGRTTPEQHARIVHGAVGAMAGPDSALKDQPKES